MTNNLTSKNKPNSSVADRRFSIKKRLWQRVGIALIFSFIIIIAQKAGWLDRFSDRLSLQKMDWSNNQEVIPYLKKLVIRNNLTDIPSQCLVYVINNDTGDKIVKIEVREQHNKLCMNTRPNFPLIFTFQINRIDKMIQIDKGTPNHFYPIQ